MTIDEWKKIEQVVKRLRALLASPKFGTSSQHDELTKITEELDGLLTTP